MRLQEFLKLAGAPGRANYYAVCPDGLLGDTAPQVLQRALCTICAPQDFYATDAAALSVERARELENESRTGARGGSAHNIFYIYRLQELPAHSVGPLLKAVEEAKSSRFIFQAQSTPAKIETIASRCLRVRLPYMSRATVLKALQQLNRDAKAADELGLCDGTLGGTSRALDMKDSIVGIRREIRAGVKAVPALFRHREGEPSLLDSLAWQPALASYLRPEEVVFAEANQGREGRALVSFLVLMRQKL